MSVMLPQSIYLGHLFMGSVAVTASYAQVWEHTMYKTLQIIFPTKHRHPKLTTVTIFTLSIFFYLDDLPGF